ncbi:unnamed protein product, partial [Polarella glacialis]
NNSNYINNNNNNDCNNINNNHSNSSNINNNNNNDSNNINNNHSNSSNNNNNNNNAGLVIARIPCDGPHGGPAWAPLEHLCSSSVPACAGTARGVYHSGSGAEASPHGARACEASGKKPAVGPSATRERTDSVLTAAAAGIDNT